MTWQPIFGEVEDEPKPVYAIPEAAPPSFDYTLKGVIVAGDIRWAILSGAGSDHLVQEGDLIDGVRIAEIKPRGIEIEIEGDRRSIDFSDSAPVEIAEIEMPVMGDAPQRTDSGVAQQSDAQRKTAGQMFQEVAFQNMTTEELREILKQAEQKRRERGWVIESRD
jgi:hypothetical protein